MTRDLPRPLHPTELLDPADPRDLRGDAPLFDAYLRSLASERRPFTVPGHKGRTNLVGSVVSGDLPLYAGVDTMKLVGGLLAEAERRAARLWGADIARFSVGGSTHGNQALALAVGRPGDRVIVPRTLHRSLLLGLILAGLEPVWVRPEVDPVTGLPLGVPVAAVEAALVAHPGTCAVFLGDPTYVGTLGDVAGHAAAAHARGLPLVVDAAWAAHFGFHPGLPPHALARGADAVVTSAHKMLTAFTQGALVLVRTERLDAARLDRAFEATHTTSPSGAILASIDAARALLERDGRELLDGLLPLVAAARARLARIPGLVVLDRPDVDPTRIVLVVGGTGASGVDIEDDLVEAGITLEMADRDTISAVVTMADDAETIGALVAALEASIGRRRGAPRPVVPAAAWSVDPRQAIPPRDAFFARRDVVPFEQADGRISAELVAPYPPGVPVLAPGEEITADVLDALRAAAAHGTRIAYAADPSLRTLEVVAG